MSGLAPEGPFGELHHGVGEGWNDARDDGGLHAGGLDAMHREQRPQLDGILVRGSAARALDAKLMNEPVAIEETVDDVGVADVHCKKHRAGRLAALAMPGDEWYIQGSMPARGRGGADDRDDVSTILRPKIDEAPTAADRYAIAVSDGVDQGLRLVLDAAAPTRALVGQSPVCDLRLSDRQVSRRHAALELTARGLRLGSSVPADNTVVNGLPLGEVYLRGGEIIRMGDTTLVVEREQAGPVQLTTAMRFGRMIGGSVAMRQLYPLCDRVAATDIPVIIEGETGTGKEVLAEALYEASPRSGKPFVVFDCTACPAVAGGVHPRGSRARSVHRCRRVRTGVFEEANGGVLFIDEIGELDPNMQPKLLRAIERSEIQRVGSNQWSRVDVRIIAATRRDLDHEVQSGRFRDDLFFRLAVGRIELPPLRRRSGDIALLTRHFWRSLGGEEKALPGDLISRFEDYTWPGNVRELHNAVARALALGETVIQKQTPWRVLRPPLTPWTKWEAIPGGDVIDGVLANELPLTRARERVVAEFERRYVQR